MVFVAKFDVGVFLTKGEFELVVILAAPLFELGAAELPVLLSGVNGGVLFGGNCVVFGKWWPFSVLWLRALIEGEFMTGTLFFGGCSVISCEVRFWGGLNWSEEAFLCLDSCSTGAVGGCTWGNIGDGTGAVTGAGAGAGNVPAVGSWFGAGTGGIVWPAIAGEAWGGAGRP